jgi:DNA anti-recombination protein RmuC
MIIAQALGAALLAAAALAGLQTWRLHSLQTERAEEKAQLEADRADAEARARQTEQLMADGARKAADNYAKQINRVRTDADASRTELERLRDTIGVPSRDAAQDAAAAAGADDATRARIVVGQCAATLQAMAATADQCEARLSGLQDWARAVSK